MAESEYSALKTQIEELVKSIEGIDKEAASFSAAKAELVEIAKNLHKISGDLSQAVKTSEAVLDQVDSIAVTSTLQSMKSSAEKYAENIENYFNQTKVVYAQQIQEIQARIDSSNTDIKKFLKSSVDKHSEDIEVYFNQSKLAYTEHAKEIQNRIDSSSADFKKKLLIIGGISIVISIVALIIALF